MITCAQAKLIIIGNPTTLSTLDKLWLGFLHDIHYSRGWVRGIPGGDDYDLESIDVYTESSSIIEDEQGETLTDDDGEVEDIEGDSPPDTGSSEPEILVDKDGRLFFWKTGVVSYEGGLRSDVKVFLDKPVSSIPGQ